MTTFRSAAMAAVAMAGALCAGPALAVQTDGFQTIVDFEEFDAGKGAIVYAGLDTFIKGGVVTVGGGWTPHSGTKVYVGTNISTMQTNGDFNFNGVDYWPGLAAWVSPGASTVFVTFYGYDPDDQALHVLGTAQTSGSDANQYFSFEDLDFTAPDLLSMSFSSADPFAVDDLMLGLVDVGPGIPEPATWAVMLLGFAGVGSVLRRRQARALSAS